MELQDLSQKSQLVQNVGYSKLDFEGEFEEQFTIIVHYYKTSKIKLIIYILLLICTCGLLYLFQRWFFSLQLILHYQKCSFHQMTHVLITKTKNNIKIANDTIVEIKSAPYALPKSLNPQIFYYELCQYYIDSQTRELFYLKNSFSHLTTEAISSSKGLEIINNVFGQNIMDIPIKPIPFLLFDEILTPFNIFQFAALALWAYDDYLGYSIFILILTLIQIAFALKDLREQLLKIRNMILFSTEVDVIRNGLKISVSSADLVPADLILIKNRSKLPCDCILIQGSCIMNEAILTGESIPINKTSLLSSKQLFTIKGNENSILYSGTNCLRSYTSQGGEAKAIVYQTGFQTMKGSLARSIMFSKTQTFSFYRDSMRYLFVLALLGVIFSSMTMYVDFQFGSTVWEALIDALEIMTIIVPPTLPTALGAGISLAISRLEEHSIQCIKPDKVNVAAKVNIIGFDKTGTLTDLGLEVLGCRPIKAHGFDKQSDISEVCEEFVRCMATCHSLSMIDNELQGDPIDLNMFQQTGWSFKDGSVRKQNVILNVIRRFDFIAELQRMSVIVDDGKIYCKGSPEMIKLICLEVPPNYETILQRYTSKGYRVLACGHKSYKGLDAKGGAREIFEQNLEFLGFIIFENKLKQESTSTIKELKSANLKTLMVTGDNPFTAINIGMQCGILDSGSRIFLGVMDQGRDIKWSEIEDKSGDLNIERSCYSLDHMDNGNLSTKDILKLSCQFQLAITGDVFCEIWRMEDIQEQRKLLNQILVYSRMKPNHKGDLMTLLKQNKNNILGFCGDGTNDTCALRAADVGLALSTEDASLAAPFTSTIFNISSILTLIQEGRASLVTSVECFKFMTLYSCIQSCIVFQCYLKQTDLSTYQYLYMDLWLIIPLAFTMDLTKAYYKLANYRPQSDLVSVPVLASVIILVFICASTQFFLILLLQNQQFFQNSNKKYEDDKSNYFNSMLIVVGNTQVLATAIAFTQGPPFRQKVYKNYYFMASVIIGIIGHVLVLLFPINQLEQSFPIYFRWELIVFNIIIGLVIVAYEKLVIHYLGKTYSQRDE